MKSRRGLITLTVADVDPIFFAAWMASRITSAIHRRCSLRNVGPGGLQTITGYKKLSAWMIGEPDRLWLQTDNGRVIVLR
jgi:hypothetical protein